MRLCGISSRFQLLSPGMGQVTHALLTRPPLSQMRFHSEEINPKCFARLACVKHAASVHPEPGSNSLKIKLSPSQNQPFLANPSLVYCFRFVQKMFLIRTFEDVFYCSVVKFLCCLSSEATLTIYHNCFCLSTTFFISFFCF